MSVLGIWLAVAAPAWPIDWNAPAGCPDAADVTAQVQRIRGDAPLLDAPRVTGVVQAGATEGFVLTLEIVGPDGGVDRRTMAGESCEAVTEAGALVIALRLDDAAPAVQPEPDPPPDPAPLPEPPASVVAAEPEPAVASEPTRSKPAPTSARPEPVTSTVVEPLALEGWISLGGGAALGILPGVGGTAELAGGIEGRYWRVGLSLVGLPVRRAPHPDDADVTGRFDLVAAGALGCGVPITGRLAFPLCARLEVGGMRGVGQGAVAVPEPGWSPWIGLGASARASWRVLRWLAPYVEAGAMVGANRPGFTIGDLPGTLYEAGRVGGRFTAGVELHLSRGPGPASAASAR